MIRSKDLGRLAIFLLVITTIFILLAAPLFAAPPDNNPGGGPPQTPPGQDRVEVLIGFYGNTNRNLVETSGGEVTHEFTLVKVISAKLPQQAIDALSKNPHIRFIEPELEMMSVSQVVPWGISRVYGNTGYPFPSWQLTKQHNITIAVLDTGIVSNHPDLTSVRGGVNTIDSTPWSSDLHGHGTHVAGTIAAADNNFGVVGVAPGFDLYAVKVLSDNGGGTTTSVVRGIEWAVNNNIKIVNMSLGSGGHSITMQEACDAAYQAGVLLVAAAGNDSGGSVLYPARYSSVIAVSASDSNNKLASFSNVGPTVELIAPGVSVRSTTPGNTYSTFSGTSMASPHVAGAAAHAWSLNSSLTNVQVRNLLTSTAQNLSLPAEHQGHGLVRADLAAAAAAPAPAPEPETSLTYNLTLALSGEGTITPVVGTSEHEEGSVIDIQATPGDGWQFVGWQGAVADPTASTTTVLLDSDKIVTAQFEVAPPANTEPVIYTLQLSNIGTGTTSPSAGSYEHEEGSVIEIQATPGDGWQFKEWQGAADSSDSSSTTVLIDNNKTVTAVFELIPEPEPVKYNLQISVSGSGTVSPAAGTHQFDEGAEVTLTAAPASGWQFKAWEGDVNGSDASATITMDKHKIAKAIFEPVGPPAPVLRAPADGAVVVGTTITFSWNRSAGANRYQIQLLNAKDNSVYRSITLKNVVSYKMSKMPNNGTEFIWQVRAGNSTTWGEWSEPRTFKNNDAPATPTLRSPASGARAKGKTITFSWNKAARASGYELEIRRADTGELVRNAVVTKTSHRQGGFRNDGSAYTWRVRARNPVGYSDWSQERRFNNF